MTRAKREGTPVAVAPLAITQNNCIAALGMNERRYLEWIIKRGVPCKKEGKLRIVEASTALRFLAPEENSTGDKREDAESFDEGVDRILAVVGRRRVR
jgi:hypothetical protein